MERYIEIDTNGMEAPSLASSLFERRRKITQSKSCAHEVTLVVVAYNRQEKVKTCVESVLRYTTGVNYELLLIDNGSTDHTLDYFLSVDYEHKKVIRITKNLGLFYPLSVIDFHSLSNFFCLLNDDAYVTPNWMDNLLACIKSDQRIALAAPMYSCRSWDIDDMTSRTFSNYEDMLQRIDSYNISDPTKWGDMIRPSTFCALFRKEAITAIGWPYWDVGFYHNYADDDLGFRFRRMGYRTIKAGDTWVYHDHNYDNQDIRQTFAPLESRESDYRNFKEKYFGIEYKDFTNFYFPYLQQFPTPVRVEKASILGVDVACGTPALDIKNWLRSFGIFNIELSAFTRDPKYWVDLKTICSGLVACDREEFLLNDFAAKRFDYIVADYPINCYHDPKTMLQTLFQLCEDDGYVICKLFNAFSFREYMTLLEGQGDYTAQKISCNISLERFRNMLESYGTVIRQFDIASKAEDDIERFAGLLPQCLTAAQRDAVEEMKKITYMFVVEKK